ncbi:hypothetical protein Dsin_031921 [Dipteronia sinensis]|uniref:PGG domain-containing protein n=1 Tax=Dipteronia sinensis TaxID=43782 RepID=A0AAD9ZNB5_9ROSI|nr:hypothetical protein Dsin_031921 [Dipteronia sinensis]
MMIKTLSIDQKIEITAELARGSGGAHDLSWKDKLGVLHNAIIVVCSLLATCCFDAIISPPGGVWQTRPSNDVIHAENIKNISAFQMFVLDYNTTLKDLLAPNKAMSMAMQPKEYVNFLFADATCFMASLLTIYLVTLAVCSKNKGMFSLAIYVMLHIVFISAVFLYFSIVELTSNAGAIVTRSWIGIGFLLF